MSERPWLAETITPGVRVSYEAERVLHHARTGYQDVQVIENGPFGRVMMLDGATQVTSADEFAYHEMMSHVPLLTHGRAAGVLIIGGGDCGLAEEVLKHASVRNVTQVELDPAVVELARRHFSAMNSGVFSDARFDLRIDDGARFVEVAHERFDVVLVDSTDPTGAAGALFTAQFYGQVRRCLRPGGVLVTQAGVPFLQRTEFATAMRHLATVFPVTSCYLVAVPSYFGGHLALGWASCTVAPRSVTTQQLAQRAQAAGLATRYYTPEVHTAAFALPAYIGEIFAESVCRQSDVPAEQPETAAGHIVGS